MNEDVIELQEELGLTAGKQGCLQDVYVYCCEAKEKTIE